MQSGDRCPSCGAGGEAGRLYCGHCGARVAHGVADLESYRTGPERFERVRVAPGFAAARRHDPPLSAAREVGWPLLRLAGGALVAVWVAGAVIPSGDGELILFVLAASAIFLVAAVRGLVVGIRRVRAPTERLVAIVTADRYVVTGWKRDPVGLSEHRLRLRDQQGDERSVFAPAALMGEIAIGDIGVAFLRSDRLVEFRWFDIMAPPLQPGEMPRAAGCPTCGGRQRFGPVSDRCAWCGEPLPRPDLGEFGARFRAAAASPAARAAGAREVRGGLPSLFGPIAFVGFGSFYAWIGWKLRDLLAAAIDHSAWFTLVPVALVAPLAGGLVWLARRSAAYRAPRENQLALVVRTRSQRVRKWRQSQHWLHFVTIAAPSGARRELNVMPETAGRLAAGTIGIAHLRGDWLAGFTSLEG